MVSIFDRHKSCRISSGKEEHINRAGVRVHQHAFVIAISETLHIISLTILTIVRLFRKIPDAYLRFSNIVS